MAWVQEIGVGIIIQAMNRWQAGRRLDAWTDETRIQDLIRGT